MKTFGLSKYLGAAAVVAALSMASANAGDTVKVFLLAGQSNMEGKAQQKLIDHQATEVGLLIGS